MVKLTDSRIRWIVRHVYIQKDTSSRDAAHIYNISVRRVQQLVNEYKKTGRMPVLNPKRRPKTTLSKEDEKIIETVWKETFLGARLLYYELKRRGYNIALNKIHKLYRERGYTRPNPRKQKKRKRCRYERRYSGSLVHGDWHRKSVKHPYVIVWMDDASRNLLAAAEFDAATAENSILTMKDAIYEAESMNVIIRSVNTDRGTQFYSNRNDSKSEFEKFLDSKRIEFIPSRKGNPQTNGKVERFWLEYDRHRDKFNTIEEFREWYNNRIHGSLWLEIGETPAEAFIRKSRPEAILGRFIKMNGGVFDEI